MEDIAEKVRSLIWKKPRTTTFDYFVNGTPVTRDTLLLSEEKITKSINSFINNSVLKLELKKVESGTVTKIYFKADTSKYEEELERLQLNLEGIYITDKEEEINMLLDTTCEVMGLSKPTNAQRLVIFSKFNDKMANDFN